MRVIGNDWGKEGRCRRRSKSGINQADVPIIASEGLALIAIQLRGANQDFLIQIPEQARLSETS
jgi:hypothetical protein